MLKHGACLRQGNTREPLKKLVDGSVLFEVFKQGGNRHPSAAKNPSTTCAIWIALNYRARRPIDHKQMVALWEGERNRIG